MRPRSFATSPLLTDSFGKGRVDEISRQLRALKLFPKGQKSISNIVSVPQAVVFLYLLACNSTPGTLPVHLEILAWLNNKAGDRFFNDFVNLLRDPKLLAKVTEVEVSTGVNNPIFAIIRYRTGKHVYYNPEPTGHPIVNSCRLSSDFLKAFAGQLSADFEATWKPFASTTKNIIRKNPTCESLELLADACRQVDNLEKVKI